MSFSGPYFLIWKARRFVFKTVYLCEQPKLNAILRESCSTPTCFCPKMASKTISEHQKFPGEHAPRPPTLACLYMHTYQCDPPSKNPGYGPEQ